MVGCSHLDILQTEVVQAPPEDCWEGWKDFDKEWQAFDDVKGGELPAHLVRSARLRELRYLAERRVYEYASTSEAMKRTHRRPLGLKWIDCNKGDSLHPNIRSRLVCTEVRPKGVEAIFAATPPLESLRMLIVILSQTNPEGEDDPMRNVLAHA